MSLGEARKKLVFDEARLATFAKLKRALAGIGQVNSVHSATFAIQGEVRYGLQRAKVKVVVTPAKTGTMVNLIDHGSDICAVGAMSSVNYLCEAMPNLDNPDYVANRLGIGPAKLGLHIAPLASLFLFLFCVTHSIPLWLTLAVIWFVFGLLFVLGLKERQRLSSG